MSQFFDDMWKKFDAFFNSVNKVVDEEVKELDPSRETRKKVVTEERDGFTYRTTTIVTRIRGMFEGDGYFSARQVAHVIASRYDADHDDWVAERLAVLRAQGEKAKARVVWAKKDGRYVFQVMVRREDGRVEQTRQPQN